MSYTQPKSNNGSKIAIGCGIAAAVVMLLLIAGFSALWYFGFVQRGGIYDELRAELAKSQLSSIVPYIELYKVSNDVYPEKLEDIQPLIPEGVVVMLIDVSAPPLGEQRLYFYEQIADGYYLLSVGADDKPFTRDDIFPEIGALQNSGLVIPTIPSADNEKTE